MNLPYSFSDLIAQDALDAQWTSDFLLHIFEDSDAAKKSPVPLPFSLFCLAPPEAAPELHRRRSRPRGARLVSAGRGARRPPVGGPVSVHLVSHRPPARARWPAGTAPGRGNAQLVLFQTLA